MMWEWLRTLDDDAIVDWANKGLLKRGAKTLAATDPGGWTLTADHAEAHIESHTQTLGGAGFAALHCDCPAYGPCHHLCAFVFGLRARAAAVTEPGDAPVKSATATPWLDGAADSVANAFGAPAVRKALHWLAQGFEAALNESDGALIAELSDPDEVTVRIPRAGGLTAASCSCKAATCAHRALAALQARRAAGVATPPLPETVLDDTALACLSQTRQWLTALTLQGTTGIGPAFLDQGEALATELRQADLPRPGALLATLTVNLRDDRLGRRGAAERIGDNLAALWMCVRGLAQHPLPRPFHELAGVHRQTYRRQSDLILHGIAAEVWHTRSGQRGFSLHFQDAGSGRYLRWSESRRRGFDPDWSPEAALARASLGERPIERLLASPHRLLRGWISDDGRLSAREGTQLADAPTPSPLPPPDDPVALLREHAASLQADPWRPPSPSFARLAVIDCGMPETDAVLQHWTLQVQGDGMDFALRGELHGAHQDIRQALQRTLAHGNRPAELFGRIDIVDGTLRMTPIGIRWQAAACFDSPATGWHEGSDRKDPGRTEQQARAGRHGARALNSCSDMTSAALEQWLARGDAWLAEIRISGLADLSESVRNRGRSWADEAALLGWTSVAALVDRCLDAQLAPHERGHALLDVTAWVATARRLRSVAPHPLPTTGSARQP